MSHYVWDLGFDFKAVSDENDNSFLQYGFVSLQTTYNAPGNPVGIQAGDIIGFNAFNVTSGARLHSCSIVSGTITFRRAVVDQEVVSPFNGSDNSPLTMIQIGPLDATQTSPSVIFSASSSETRFPFYHLVGPLPVATIGKFLMTVLLEIREVDGPEGPKIKRFRADPEMIVGGLG